MLISRYYNLIVDLKKKITEQKYTTPDVHHLFCFFTEAERTAQESDSQKMTNG